MIFRRYPTLRRVIVNTKTDKAFRGVLWRKTHGIMVLRNAELLRENGASLKIDGELVIEVNDIDFMQVLP